MRNSLMLLSATLVVAACGTVGGPPNLKESQAVVFNEPPSQQEAMRRINAYLGGLLLDPMSAQTNCSDVTGKSWIRGNPFKPAKYGYLVLCNVNAKNRFGGYTGAKLFAFRFNGGE
ncbi:MAG: hypothetical protein NTX56_11130, partial [Proteobacteria bacterium]|nr:hypothetical protein [Pseudomonadota bacterium]